MLDPSTFPVTIEFLPQYLNFVLKKTLKVDLFLANFFCAAVDKTIKILSSLLQ